MGRKDKKTRTQRRLPAQHCSKDECVSNGKDEQKSRTHFTASATASVATAVVSSLLGLLLVDHLRLAACIGAINTVSEVVTTTGGKQEEREEAKTEGGKKGRTEGGKEKALSTYGA